MAREERNIYFSPDEVLRALQVYCEQTGKQHLSRLFVDHLLTLNVSVDPEFKLVAVRKDAPSATFPFPNAEVAAALILFCRMNSVPLPRSGTKALNYEGDEVILRIGIKGVGNT